MSMGGCIFLIAAGAILLVGVDWNPEAVNIDLVGLIMILVGIFGVGAYVSIYKRRRMQAPPPAAPVVEEHRYIQ
ncbi:hypothetical protein SRB5_49060 [Streptomyces sp. RB5]|uniref:Uncharacterized protein n=1 Tax=Streptomyces smaragdinus TaxID=2585196 RepID=A0A7K0CMM2_9ACTN|nr:hypothetical protein [Streptomyces smaragdinus]MQY14730.1 hypothetical protein [Streptomyces smaragdinus]